MGVLSQNLFTHDRRHGGGHHDGDAADAALGAARGCRCARTNGSGSSARSSTPSGFVPNLERLLLAVDDSANGKFASRLAGRHRRLGRQADHDHRARAAALAGGDRSPQRGAGQGAGAQRRRRHGHAGGRPGRRDPRQRRRDHAHPPGGESPSGRRRGAERLRPAHRRDGEDAHGARRIQPGDHPRRRRLRRPARGRDRRRDRSPPGTSRSAGSSSRSTAPTFRGARPRPASRWQGRPGRA